MRKNLLILSILFLVTAQAAGYVDPNGVEQEALPAKKVPADLRVIVIDPGHGGKDFGAIGKNGLREKNIALDVAKRLKTYLEANGFQVYLTRGDDRFVSLQERADFVNRIDADLFISIHGNAARNRRAHGYETFYLSDPANDNIASSISSGDGYVKYENFSEENSEIGKMYVKLLDSASSEDRSFSIGLADKIHQALKGYINARDRGVKRARFFVLRNTSMPAVLIEVGFVSNPSEEHKLARKHHRDKIARGIAHGVVNFRNAVTGLDGIVGLKQDEKKPDSQNCSKF